MHLSLNGKWEFSEAKTLRWLPAEVPGCNFLDLIENGIIDDPFIGTNEEKCKWVGEKDWIYRKEFFISEENLNADKILLVCKKLDTVCTVKINGNIVAHCENYHIGYEFDIKKFLTAGKNIIEIIFFSPVNYVEQFNKKEMPPPNANGQNGIVHIRKPQCHFGWDWGPVLPPSGIQDDIFIDFLNTARISDVRINQHHSENHVQIRVDTETDKFTQEEIECKTILTHPDKKEDVLCGFSGSFTVENPELWQTFELSQKKEQPLYTVTTILSCNGKEIDRKEKKIGLKTIKLNRSHDEFGSNFQFILNGVPLFIKGANYIPPDSFPTRFTEEKMNKLLDAAQFSNLNMLRIWGGGGYESDLFYEECDRRGILLWQDFGFACQPYPFFREDFLENVKKEVAYNVKRLSHHPCLALWCGNNEIEDMSLAWCYMRKYVEWTEKFFHNILEKEIRKIDTETPFIPTSPCGTGHNEDVHSDKHGDTHLWGVWHGLQPMTYYRKRMTRFCSEFGFESLPDIKTVRFFAENGNFSLSDKVFKSHQKCSSGNDKMLYYISSRFDLPEKFEDLIYLSQVTQQECVLDATEHWRRNKGRCNGSMYWQFNDCWPVCSWSSYDYFGNYKALQYSARHTNAPLSISIEDTEKEITVYALNDFSEEKTIEIEYMIFDFESGIKKTQKEKLTLKKLENKKVFTLNRQENLSEYDISKTAFCAKLYENGKLLMKKAFLFDKEKNLSLPKAEINCSYEIRNDELLITLYSEKFARLVKLESSVSSNPFSDNFFDLLPKEEKTVKITPEDHISIEELKNSISVMSCCDVIKSKNYFRNIFAKIKVWLSPMNVITALHHGKTPD